MSDVSIKDLKRAARELNNLLGLKPLLNLLAEEEELSRQLKEAAQCLEPGDEMSDETRTTLEGLDVTLPEAAEEKEEEPEEKSKKGKKKSKEEPEEEEEEEEEEEPEEEEPTEEESEETEEEEEEPEEEEETESNKKEKKVAKPAKEEKEEKEEKPTKGTKSTKKETPKRSVPKKNDEEKVPAGYVRAEEAAKILGFDEKRQVRILARKGKLPAKRTESGRVLFKISDLEKYKSKMKSKKEED